MSGLPSPPRTYTRTFSRFDGGLNLLDGELRLNSNESPELVNLWWEDGVLHSRPGQAWATADLREDPETQESQDAQEDESPVGYAASEPFWGHTILHIGDGLYLLRLRDDAFTDGEGLPRPRLMAEGVPENSGTFFRFGDWLFYKNRGGFFKIAYQAEGEVFSVYAYDRETCSFLHGNTAERAYVPTIVINASPLTGGGDLYQPENRLSDRKRVTYNALTTPETVTRQADGTRRAFLLTDAGAGDGEEGLSDPELFRGIESVYVDNAYWDSALYTVDLPTATVLFHTAPAAGRTLTFTLKLGNREYHLPVRDIDSVEEVTVDGIPMEEDRDYTVDLAAGTVTFEEAPAVTVPPTGNTVSIVYRKANPDALNAVLNCPYAAVYGTGTQLCAVLGGDTGRSRAQPNAVFWSGNTDLGLDPTYWPMTHYNLAGETENGVTGFGRQYDQLLVFQEASIGKLEAGLETVEGRENIALSYRRVNDRIGCDMPGSIQLIENNLVFASSGGVFRVRSASAAYENNLECVSRKINGSDRRPGLLYDLRTAPGTVSSHDDGRRYYLSVNGHVWVWDYAGGGAWYYFTDFHPVCWFQSGGETYHLNQSGRVTRLGAVLSDYGEGIRKVYRMPLQNFGGYDRLKDVDTLLLSAPAEFPSHTEVRYETDHGTRTDATPLVTAGTDRLSRRDLTFRDLSVPLRAAVFRRRPKCRHVRHFSLRLENQTPGEDLAVYAMELHYRLCRRER